MNQTLKRRICQGYLLQELEICVWLAPGRPKLSWCRLPGRRLHHLLVQAASLHSRAFSALHHIAAVCLIHQLPQRIRICCDSLTISGGAPEFLTTQIVIPCTPLAAIGKPWLPKTDDFSHFNTSWFFIHFHLAKTYLHSDHEMALAHTFQKKLTP